MDKKQANTFLTNKVCEYFFRINPNDQQFKYKCGIDSCNKELSGKNKSNLVAHVKRKHRNFFQENFSEAKYHVSVVVPLPIKRLKYIQNCVEFIAVNGHAFRILNESGMRYLRQNDYDELKLGGLGSGLRGPHYPAIKKHIKYLSAAIVKKIKAETNGAFVSIMADSATKYRRSILGLSIQYMYHGELKIRTIGMINMTVPQTAENLMNAIVNQLKIYQIETHQILSITTDNANSMAAMVNRMNAFESNVNESHQSGNVFGPVDSDDEDNSDSDCSDENDLFELNEFPSTLFDMGSNNDVDDNSSDTSHQSNATDNISEAESDGAELRLEANAILNETEEFERILKELEKRFSIYTLNINGIRCAVHTLQLAIRHALKATGLKELISKCRQICKLLKKGSVKRLLTQNNIFISIPKLDCKTRWNSTYRMVRIQFVIAVFFPASIK